MCPVKINYTDIGKTMMITRLQIATPQTCHKMLVAFDYSQKQIELKMKILRYVILLLINYILVCTAYFTKILSIIAISYFCYYYLSQVMSEFGLPKNGWKVYTSRDKSAELVSLRDKSLSLIQAQASETWSTLTSAPSLPSILSQGLGLRPVEWQGHRGSGLGGRVVRCVADQRWGGAGAG